MVVEAVATDYVARQHSQEIVKVDSYERQKHKCSK